MSSEIRSYVENSTLSLRSATVNWPALGFTPVHDEPEPDDDFLDDHEYVEGPCPLPGCSGTVTISATDRMVIDCTEGCDTAELVHAIVWSTLPTEAPTHLHDLEAINGWWQRIGELAEPSPLDRGWIRVVSGPDGFRETCWYGPYRPDLELRSDSREVAMGNCPVCWPRLSMFDLDIVTGQPRTCEHGCRPSLMAEALVAESDGARIDLLRDLDDERTEQLLDAFEGLVNTDELDAARSLDAALDDLPTPRRQGGLFTRIDEVLALPPVEYLIEGLLPEDATALVWGKPNSFKSFFMVDLALHVATGRPWHSREVKPGRVVYAALEGIRGTGKRLRAWSLHHNVDLTGFDDFRFVQDLHLNSNDDVRNLIAGVIDFDPKLVIIDTLSRAIPGVDENAAKEMSLVLDVVERLRRQGCTVVMLHHANKGGDYRGSTTILGAVDVSIELDRPTVGSVPGPDFAVKVHKQKDDEEGQPLQLTVEKVALSPTESSLVVIDPSGPRVLPIDQQILAYLRDNPDSNTTDISNAVTGKKQDTIKVLHGLKLAGTVVMTQVGKANVYRLADGTPPPIMTSAV